MEYKELTSYQIANGGKTIFSLSFDYINYVIYHPLFKLQHNIDA